MKSMLVLCCFVLLVQGLPGSALGGANREARAYLSWSADKENEGQFSVPVFFGHSRWVTKATPSFVDTMSAVGLKDPCAVSFVRRGESTIRALRVERINAYQIAVSADLSSAAPGVWDIVVKCSDMRPTRLRWLRVLPEVLESGREGLVRWKGGYPPTIARATVLSEAVFIGVVENIVSEKLGKYLTKVTIKTEEWLKGHPRKDWVEVRLRTGTCPDGTSRVLIPEPKFELESRVLVFALYPVERDAPGWGTYFVPGIVCPIREGKVYAGLPLEEFARTKCLRLEDVRKEIKAVAKAVEQVSYSERP